jgi:hypothetical protein
MYEHPASSEHHSAQHRLVLDLRLRIPTRVSCHFGCFVCVALPVLQKKSRNKKPKKSHSKYNIRAGSFFHANPPFIFRYVTLMFV